MSLNQVTCTELLHSKYPRIISNYFMRMLTTCYSFIFCSYINISLNLVIVLSCILLSCVSHHTHNENDAFPLKCVFNKYVYYELIKNVITQETGNS